MHTEGNFLEAKAAEFFLKWQGILKVSGDNLHMTIPQAEPVGKIHTFFAIGRLFLKRQRIFKAAEFLQSGKGF